MSDNIEAENVQNDTMPGQTEQVEGGIIRSDDHGDTNRRPNLTEEISTHVTITRRLSADTSAPMEEKYVLPLVAQGLQQLVDQRTPTDPTSSKGDVAGTFVQMANTNPSYTNTDEIMSYERHGSKYVSSEKSGSGIVRNSYASAESHTNSRGGSMHGNTTYPYVNQEIDTTRSQGRRGSMFGNTTYTNVSQESDTAYMQENLNAGQAEIPLGHGGVSFNVEPGNGNRKQERKVSLLASRGYYAVQAQEKEKPIFKKVTKLLSPLNKFYAWALFVPMVMTTVFAAAIIFPPEARSKAPYILWTNGALTYDDQGQPRICPRASICAEGILQLICIVFARLTAFMSYVVMGLTFVSKMHSTIHYFSTTYLSTKIPFQSLHEVHKYTGKFYAYLALVHTLTHYLRYILRRDSGQLLTQVHISGLVAILSMITVVLIMSVFRTRFAFEDRFNIHWFFLLLVAALFFHTSRTRIITLIFFCSWAADYAYGVFRRTHRLGVVEFTPIGEDAGTQMLWRNPEGFSAKSGEYVFVKLPWLQDGGDEWHPFSIYLREATEDGLNVFRQTTMRSLNISATSADLENVEKQDLAKFTQNVIDNDFAIEQRNKVSNEARQNLNSYDTTQVFISPVGDWSKGLYNQVIGRKQLQSCWVKGPFTSPYFVAHEYGHFVMVASGIGITPALGVMGQFPGFCRTKILMWCTRSKDMLMFFAPLLKDAHLTVVFYTGKQKLELYELAIIQSYGNIYVEQKRADSLTGTIASLIIQFENNMNEDHFVSTIKGMDQSHIQAWCVLYCGGSKHMRNQMQEFTKENGLGWEYEMFNW